MIGDPCIETPVEVGLRGLPLDVCQACPGAQGRPRAYLGRPRGYGSQVDQGGFMILLEEKRCLVLLTITNFAGYAMMKNDCLCESKHV